MRIDWLSTRPTKPYLTTCSSHPIAEKLIIRIDYLPTHFPHITICKWGTWKLPINSETAIQRCFMKIAFQNVSKNFQEIIQVGSYFSKIQTEELQLF